MLKRLSLFAITKLGGIAQPPHAAMNLQFDPDLAFYHDMALGIDPRPLIPQSSPHIVGSALKLLWPRCPCFLLCRESLDKIAHAILIIENYALRRTFYPITGCGIIADRILMPSK
jgi:hypothetical protein